MKKQRWTKRKLGIFGIFTLGRFGVIVPLTTFALKRKGFRYVLQKLPTRDLKRWLPSTTSDKRILSACKSALGIIERYSPLPGTCLSRSLVLWSTLGRYGITAELRIGIRKNTGPLPRERVPFAAHAWVEISGIPLNAPADIATLYTPFTHDITKQNVDGLTFIT